MNSPAALPTESRPGRRIAGESAGSRPPRDRLLVPVLKALVPALVFCALALLVRRYEAPAVLAVAVLVVAGVALLLRPGLATLIVVFLLYTNIPVLLYKYQGVSQLVAGAFLLLLLVPVGHHLLVRRQRLRFDGVFLLMLLYLATLLIASLRAKDAVIAIGRIQTFIVEGLILYLLLLNAVRTLPGLKRVIWTALAAASLLGALSLYQEATGDFEQQFGGLAHRNYEFMVLREQLEASPDDAELRERVVAFRNDRSRRAEGPLDEPNAFAQMLLVLLPLSLYAGRASDGRRGRLAALAAGLLILGGVVVTYSRGAFVALALLVVVAAWLRWIRPRHLLIGGLAITPVVSVAAPDYLLERVGSIAEAVHLLDGSTPGMEADVAIRGRATEMFAALQAFLDHPVTGVGPGQYTPFYSVEYQQRDPRVKFLDVRTTRRAHSLILEMAAELGILGLAAFAGVVGLLLRELWRARRRLLLARPELADLSTACMLAILGYLTAGLFLHLAYERYFWLLLALGGICVQLARAEEAETGRATCHPSL